MAMGEAGPGAGDVRVGLTADSICELDAASSASSTPDELPRPIAKGSASVAAVMAHLPYICPFPFCCHGGNQSTALNDRKALQPALPARTTGLESA